MQNYKYFLCALINIHLLYLCIENTQKQCHPAVMCAFIAQPIPWFLNVILQQCTKAPCRFWGVAGETFKDILIFQLKNPQLFFI